MVEVELLMTENSLVVEVPVVVVDLVVLVVLVVFEGLVRDDRLVVDHSLMVVLVVLALDDSMILEFSSVYLAPILMEEVVAKTKLMTLTPFLVAAGVVHGLIMI